ncbi:MAG: phosphatase PAP2 family protein [Ferruginibacter sp.]
MNICYSQTDSLKIYESDIDITLQNNINVQHYNVGNGKILSYPKPKLFDFITHLPKDAGGIVTTAFKKEAIKPWLIVAGSTAIFLLADEAVMDGVHNFSKAINLSPEEEYNNLISIRIGKEDVRILKAPKNINTALYQLGQGFPSLLLGAGLLTYGKINNDYRAMSTASQLAESFILMGVGTQIIKRISGRETPGHATVRGGKWRPFPSFSNYQNNTPIYDAFPSGHLATLMSTVTVLTENYPEKRWIKPTGYVITGLVGYAMINTDVHWISDYPLAIALGYLCAKQVAKSNRSVNNKKEKSFSNSLSYTIGHTNGRVMPGIIYKF